MGRTGKTYLATDLEAKYLPEFLGKLVANVGGGKNGATPKDDWKKKLEVVREKNFFEDHGIEPNTFRRSGPFCPGI